MTGFGNNLKEERIRQGYSLEAVEKETKIRKLYIKALEEENFAALPPQTYAIGFARRYSKFLNLNDDDIVEKFKNLAFPNKSEVIENKPPVKNTLMIKEKKDTQRKIIIAVVFLFVAIIMGNTVNEYISKKAISPPSQVNNYLYPTPNQELPVKNELELTIKIKPGLVCWISVVVDGEFVYSGIVNESAEKKFIAEQSIRIKAGNAGAVELYVNNTPMEALGKIGEVVEKEFNI